MLLCIVFGDSTIDTGNNNYLKGTVANYGKDFPGHLPTGRFSNGKLVVDFFASILNLKDTVPPYLDPNLSDKEPNVCLLRIRRSGIDSMAATLNAISMSHQIK
ncbi:GDSL esterase/lipase, partial [Mucuna pruriens]